MNDRAYPDFSGQIVVVYVNSVGFLLQGQPGWVLEKASLESKAGRLFLVGKPAKSESLPANWAQDSIVNVAWDLVSHYLVFESAEAYVRALRSFQNAPMSSGTPGKGSLWRKLFPTS